MKARFATRQTHPLAVLVFLISIVPFSLSACGTFQVGVERTATPVAVVATATPSPTTTDRVTATQETPPVTPTMTVPTPTETPTSTPDDMPTSELIPTPVPDVAALRVVVVRDGNIWLWTEGQENMPLTNTGDVLDVKISDDGTIVAFTRGRELWMVRSDGTDQRLLLSEVDQAKMEPRAPFDLPVVLYRFDWVPGTHIIALNTQLRTEIGLILNDDLRLVDAETLEQTVLLAPGQGGEFHCSPDGQRIAVVTAGTVGVIDLQSREWRLLFTYTPPTTASEFQYYASPAWAADSTSLRVAIPPADLFAQPTQPTTVWQLNVDGTSAQLLGNIPSASGSTYAFSPDLRFIAYLADPTGTSPGGEQVLLVTDLEGDKATLSTKAHNVYGWSPDSQRLAFASNTQPPQAQIAELGSEIVVPAHDDANVVSLDVRWVDESRYLYLAQSAQGWDIMLGEVGGSGTVVASVAGRQLAYDYSLYHSLVTEP